MEKLRKIVCDNSVAEKIYTKSEGGGNKPLPQWLQDILLAPTVSKYADTPYTKDSPEIKELLDNGIDITGKTTEEITLALLNTPSAYYNIVIAYESSDVEGTDYVLQVMSSTTKMLIQIILIINESGNVKYRSSTAIS